MFCLPLSALVSAVGDGGLVGYSLLGERVGFMVTSHGGAGFWLLPKGRKKKEELYIYIYIYIYRKRSKEQNKRKIRGLKKMNLALC